MNRLASADCLGICGRSSAKSRGFPRAYPLTAQVGAAGSEREPNAGKGAVLLIDVRRWGGE